MKTKNELRVEYKKIRDKIIDKKKKSKEIFDTIINNNLLDDKNVIAIYYSREDEVYTLDFIDYLLSIGKTVLLPKVKESNMVFYRITSLKSDAFIRSKIGIIEPEENNENIFNKSNIDLIIVPGICFDRMGYRIGFGGGFYDKYLSGEKIDTIGVCFQECLLDKFIPIDEYDLNVDYIVTEEEIIKTKR